MKNGWSWWLGFLLGVLLVIFLLRNNGKLSHLAEQQEIIARQQEQIADLEAQCLDLLRELPQH